MPTPKNYIKVEQILQMDDTTQKLTTIRVGYTLNYLGLYLELFIKKLARTSK